MKYSERLAALFAAAALTCCCTACREEHTNSEAPVTTVSAAAETTAPQAETAPRQTVQPPDAKKGVAAQNGEAFLYIADGSFGVCYDGTDSDASLLRYGARVAAVTGDGSYTVSADCADTAFQYEISNGAATEGYRCSGLQFAAVRIAGGAELFPNAVIRITEVRADGRPVPLIANNYTAAEDKAVYANIYHPWVKALPADARGENGKPVPAGDTGYSACIVSPDDFRTWSKVEVDFTVTHTGAD